MIKKTLLLLGVITLSACSASFEKPPVDYQWGYPPSKEVVERQAPGYFMPLLKDGNSARFLVGRAVRGHTNKGMLFGGKIEYIGWFFEVSVNAKNSFGGYTGYEKWLVMVRGDRIVGHINPDQLEAFRGTGIINLIQ